jgi:hypothetical protein
MLVFSAPLWSYEIPDENEVTMQTCRLSVKLEVIRDETLKKATGRAQVIARLTDESGNPLISQRIEFTANAGTFVCKLPEDSTPAWGDNDEEACFTTNYEGKATPYLLNIPYNQRVQVKATYSCGERVITTTASMSISRQVVKKRKTARR